ncbi:hypothetical protein J6590_017342 [Homalodisca vitripennis]|nr:hypothetical protein J6590_017342 [Homalodisca vitripennis]
MVYSPVFRNRRNPDQLIAEEQRIVSGSGGRPRRTMKLSACTIERTTMLTDTNPKHGGANGSSTPKY